MDIITLLKEPVNYIFLILFVLLILISALVSGIRSYLTLIITFIWIGSSFNAWTTASGYSTIWFAGFLTWLVWLWEASKHSTTNFGGEDTCPWIDGTDALFWSMSVPLFAFFIGLWARTFLADNADEWSAFVGVLVLGYATWLTLWRISCVLPFVQTARGGGSGFVPIN